MTGDSEADLLLEFSKLNETGDAGVIQQGLIGRKYGIDLYSDVQAPYHTAGTAAANAGMALAAAASAGDTSLSLAGVAGTTFVLANNSASARRRFTKPGSLTPSEYTQRLNCLGTEAKSLRLMTLRSAEIRRLPIPALKTKSIMAAN